MKKHMWIGLAVAGVCLYFAFRGISFTELWVTLKRGSPIPILFALVLYLVEFRLRAERWSVLLEPVRPTPGSQLVWVMMIGFFANNVLPFRMGELVRAHACGTKLKISRTASIGSILLERICDAVSFLSTFLIASFFVPFPHYMKQGAGLLGGFCILAISTLFIVNKHELRFRSLLDKSPLPLNWKAKIHTHTTHFLHSISGITNVGFITKAMGFSVVIWMLEGTFLYLVTRAFQTPINYPSAFFLMFALGLSVTLPQAPGYVGTFELFGVTALGLLGIPKNQALPVILAIHGLQFAFIATLGTIALWKEGIRFSSISKTQ